MAINDNVTPEDRFRDSLQDVIIILKKLAPLCKSIDELIDMSELAVVNSAQLNLLLQQVAPLQMKRN